MSTVIDKRSSVDDYLRHEDAAARSGGRKSEFVDGEIREMTGASREHNLLCWRILGVLAKRLDVNSFEAYPGDMRVRADSVGPYYYPDIVIAPHPPSIKKDRGDTLLDPIVVFEVLSPSTEMIDRREKLANYGRITSLIDYVLAAQDEVRFDHYSRQADGSWRLVILEDRNDTLTLPSVGIEVPLAEVYSGVLPMSGE